jgi:hypothetical protein
MKSINVGGLPGGGKSNFENMILAQVRMHGGHILGIDLHGHHPESTNLRLGDMAKLPGVEICVEENEIPAMLFRIYEEFKSRKASGRSEPIIIVYFAEILGLYNDFEAASETHSKIASEGRKFGMYAMADAQLWTKDAIRSTKPRDVSRSFVCHVMDKKEARYFMSSSPPEVEKLQPGEFFLKIKGRSDIPKLYAPLMTTADMAVLAARAQPIKPLPEPRAYQDKDVPTKPIANLHPVFQFPSGQKIHPK